MTSTPSIISQFFEISPTPFSIFFLILILTLLTLITIAIFSKKTEHFLKKYKLIDKEETPTEFLKWLLSVIVIVRTLHVFIIQPFLVDGTSMYPTLKNFDFLIIDKTYKYREYINPNTIKRNDVVVFRFEKESSPYDGNFFIKRIIGLPGDTITINGTSTKILNKENQEVKLDESYVKMPKLSQSMIITLKNDEYFVEGDNREGSYDSRAWGPIHVNQIAGKPILQIWPLSEIKITPGEVK